MFDSTSVKNSRIITKYSIHIVILTITFISSLPVRGHNMFWGVGGNDPAQVRQMNATELEKTIQARIKYMTDLTRGKYYSEKIYDMVHAADPGPKLFLNDYDVLAVGSNTDHRLDTLAKSGLPLWITELTVPNDDENIRADWYENVNAAGRPEISVPDLMTTPAPTHKHHVTHDGYHHLGQQTSSSTSATLQCATRYSTYSEIGDDKITSVACLQDEVLTSCSMITRVVLPIRIMVKWMEHTAPYKVVWHKQQDDKMEGALTPVM
ncbi:hypothetical protein KUTeg_017479, partial [Tegillarca granosa]